MAEDVFGELGEWWLHNHASSKDLPMDKAFRASLSYLGIMKDGEHVLSKRILKEWYPDSDETYMTLGEIDFESSDRVRTELIAAYAVVTPPGIPIAERIEIWGERAEKMRQAQVSIPDWFLVWRGTIFTRHPHLDLVEYLTKTDVDGMDQNDLALSLSKTLKGLASLSLEPLGFPYRLRTDNFNVFFCGMGFDVGESTGVSPEKLLVNYEQQILPHLPPKFVLKYKQLKQANL